MFSLIIASINRSEFLINYIECLQFQKFTGQLLIGDSSNSLHLKIIKDFIKKKKVNFEIYYKEMPNCLPHQCINFLIKKVKFNYSMWICDDDLLLVDTVKKCINFLEKNLDLIFIFFSNRISFNL